MGNFIKNENESKSENVSDENEAQIITVSDAEREIKQKIYSSTPNFIPQVEIKKQKLRKVYPKDPPLGYPKGGKNYKSHKAPRQYGELKNKRRQ